MGRITVPSQLMQERHVHTAVSRKHLMAIETMKKIRNLAVPRCRKNISLQPCAARFSYFYIVAMAISIWSHDISEVSQPCCNKKIKNLVAPRCKNTFLYNVAQPDSSFFCCVDGH
jgi:hypothetical protein